MVTKSKTKSKPKTSTRILVMVTYKAGHSHRSLNKPVIKVIGNLTPANFKKAVISAYNGASATGNYNIIYSASRTGKTVKLIARLYQAKRDKVGLRKFKMFSTFHHPDGERLRKQAGIPAKFFEKSGKAYPSKPPYPPDKASLLRKMVVV